MEYVAKLETDKDKITQNDVLNVKIKACEEAIKILMETHKSIEKELSSKHTKIKELQKEIIVIDDDIYDRTGEIATCNKDINDCHAQISTNKAIIAGIKQAEDDIKDVTEQIVYKQSLEAIYDEISYAFGKDGIPNLIVENILVEIEEIANSIVQDISPEIRIFFQTQKESKKKTKIETLDIMIEYDDKVRLYETFSGGERTIINFSIRFAISYYMSQKLGLKTRAIEMVVLDEVFGSLCEDGREKIIAVLQQLKKKFKQIFVISHSDLKDIFPYNIQIERDRDESRIIN
jgi:exonuclease SbcC